MVLLRVLRVLGVPRFPAAGQITEDAAHQRRPCASAPNPPPPLLPPASFLLLPFPLRMSRDLLAPLDTFNRRHTGESAAETAAMLDLLGYTSLAALTDAAVPAQIRRGALNLPAAASESASPP